MRNLLFLVLAVFLALTTAAWADKPSINNQNVQNPRLLSGILNAMDIEIDALRTLANEMRTDHATNRTAVANLKLVVDEMVTDHDADSTHVGNIKTLLNDIRTELLGDYLITLPALAIGTDLTCVSGVAFNYAVNGAAYYKAAVATGTALTPTTAIPQAKYGAFALDIGADGTIDVSGATDNGTGYDSAALAIAGLSAVAADHVRMGTVTVTKSDGAFTPATTHLNAANVTAAYTDSDDWMTGIAAAVSTSAAAALSNTSTTSPAATLTAPAITEQVTHGK